MLFLFTSLSFITLFTITSRIILLMLLSAHNRGLLLGFLEEGFQDHGWCLFLVIVCGFYIKTTKPWVFFWGFKRKNKKQWWKQSQKKNMRQTRYITKSTYTMVRQTPSILISRFMIFFESIQILLTQPVILMKTYKVLKYWSDCIR